MEALGNSAQMWIPHQSISYDIYNQSYNDLKTRHDKIDMLKFQVQFKANICHHVHWAITFYCGFELPSESCITCTKSNRFSRCLDNFVDRASNIQ